jgi:hypothetical protein
VTRYIYGGERRGRVGGAVSLTNFQSKGSGGPNISRAQDKVLNRGPSNYF